MGKSTTFQITVLSIFGALAVVGVLIFAFLASSNTGASLGTVVIWGTFPEGPINLVLRETADQDTRFAGVTYVQRDPAKYEADLTTALANGRGPDLFLMRSDYALRDSNYAIHIPYESLSQTQFDTTFLQASKVFLAQDGVVAIPLVVDPLVLFWNKDALATAGYTQPPRYWDEVPLMVPKLVKKSESGTIERAGIALGGFDNIPSAKTILSTMIMQAGGGVTALDENNELRSVLGSQGGIGVAVTALNYFTEFANPANPDYTWTRSFPEASVAFAGGDVALYIGHVSERLAISKANPNLNFELSPLPQIRNRESPLNTSLVYGLSIARTSKNPQGALTIAYLMAAPQIATPISQGLQMTSALRRVINEQEATATDQTSKALRQLVENPHKSEDAMLNFEASISRPLYDPDPVRTNAVFRALIEDTVSGAQKVSEAVQRAEAQMTDILEI